MRYFASCLIVLASLSFCAERGHAGVIAVSISDHVSPDWPNPASSYYGTGYIGMHQNTTNGFWPGFIYEASSTASFSRSVLQVDITQFLGADISSAELSYNILNGTLANPSSAPLELVVTSFTASGNLGHMWSPVDNLGFKTFTLAPTGVRPDRVTIDITELLVERTLAGGSWLGLHFQNTVNPTSYTGHWTPNVSGDQVNMELSVSTATVPEPTSAVVFGLGALCMVGFRRRKRMTI